MPTDLRDGAKPREGSCPATCDADGTIASPSRRVGPSALPEQRLPRFLARAFLPTLRAPVTTPPKPRPRALPLVLLPIALAACADGGSEDRPQSAVRIAANHHLYWFRSLPGFGTFPVVPNAVFPGRGTLSLADDSTYRITQSGSTSSPDRYALATDGALTIFNTGTGRDPTILFRGAYGLVGDNGNYFFTDRVSSGSSTSVGMYFGTRVVAGQVELEGPWHLLSLHVLFANNALISPDNVARAASGAITVAAGAAGAVRSISGTGRESNGNTLTFGGSIQNLLQNGNGDGSCNLTVDYANGTTTDSRVFAAAAGRGIVAAIDADETDGEAGLLFLVRKFDAPATPVDLTRVAGEFLVGGHTVFVNPTNAGSDSFVGVLTLTTPDNAGDGGFRLDAEGHQGIDFSYTGTYRIAADGGITLTVNGTNETWNAALNPSYDTLVLVDAVVEQRQNNAPELNLLVGIRRRPPQ